MGRVFKKLLKAAEAWRIVSSKGRLELEVEEVEVGRSLGRILAADVISPIDLPAFDKSAVDGYAVRSEDTTSASQHNPAILKVVGEVRIGSSPSFGVGRGEAARIDTGAPLPRGSNSVVPLEYARELGGYVEIVKRVAPYENVVRKGDDVREGGIVLEEGRPLRPWDVALLKSLGVRRVEVYRMPKIALLSVGSELSDELARGTTVDANRPNIAGMLASLGAEVADGGIVGDSLREVERAIAELVRRADAVVVSGGASVGARDYTVRAVERLGELCFSGVAIRPGMPTSFGLVEGKPVFALPGSPVAAYVAYKLFVETLILYSAGARPVQYPAIARLESKIPSALGFLEFARVKLRRVGGELTAVLVRRRGSSILSSIAESDGVVAIPEDCEGLPEGSTVEVYLHDRPWGNLLGL